jgi:hypothetical protein
VKSSPTASESLRKPHIGRNDPCWRGSGKKFKKCHWQTDRETAKPARSAVKSKERRIVLHRPPQEKTNRAWAEEVTRGREKWPLGGLKTHPVARPIEPRLESP